MILILAHIYTYLAMPSFKDFPHYQLATELTLASVRERFEDGQDIV